MKHLVANNNTTKEFKVGVSYEMYGYIKIQAKNEEEALEWANNHIDELPLPDNGEYVEASYEIDPEFVEEV